MAESVDGEYVVSPPYEPWIGGIWDAGALDVV
jgi:hypothetical protein